MSFKNPVEAGYVYTYLCTKVGNKILLTNSYGAVITHIEPKHLTTVPIPDAPAPIKNRINECIVQSYALRDKSNALVNEAINLLTKELHFPSMENFFKKPSATAFSVKLSDTNLRLDGSYHLPIVDRIIEHLHRYAGEVTTIGDNRVSDEVILPGRFKRVYVKEGHGRVFIGGKQLWELNPTNKKYLSPVHHANRIASQLELCENMTLITCSGTIGKITLVGKHWENWTASQHVIRVIPADANIAGYISVFLSTGFGRCLLVRNTYGSVIDEINDDQVRRTPFPLLKNQDIQSQINSLALSANNMRYEAYMLEQEALKIMNDEVINA